MEIDGFAHIKKMFVVPQRHKDYFENIWRYGKDYYEYGDNIVAVRWIGSGKIRRIEYIVEALPACSVTVKVLMRDKRFLTFSTGSGDPIEYFEIIDDMLDLVSEDMMSFTIADKEERYCNDCVKFIDDGYMKKCRLVAGGIYTTDEREVKYEPPDDCDDYFKKEWVIGGKNG